MHLTAGTRLGVYEIRSLLGAGGMGEVYRARDSKLNREVAIKVSSVLTPAIPSDSPDGTPFDAAADGRLLALVRTRDAPPSNLRVVLGWDREVSRFWSNAPR